jgi:uncharacterized protein (DUF1800 family)
MGTLCAVLCACGGGGGSAPPPASGGPPPPPPVAMSTKDAARLLEQATWGPTPSEVTRVAALGFDAYVQEQVAEPASAYSGFSYVTHTAPADCKYDASAPTGASSLCARDNYSLFQVQRQFFQHALTGPDQLRQRVAFALSQIFVVSGTEIYEAYAMAAYQNLLLQDAFVNFRQMLEDVTLSPVMGRYLNMADSSKLNPKTGALPNENYARELMQLFSLGVYKLNPDGSQLLDANNQPQPNYDQSVILGLAAAFTGWTDAPLGSAPLAFNSPLNYQGSMQSVASYHDTGAKQLVGGVTSPAGQTPEADLKAALDAVFNHPNVGPFIGKQLIQHLVTSNPSPAYVARVSAVFADNGQGMRGDMAAVIKAVLGDIEARGDAPSDPQAGHLREPALYITTLLRGLGAQSDGVYPRGQMAGMGQSLFTPPTVFNYYPPGYQLPGTTRLAPEFYIQNATTGLIRINFANQLIFGGGAPADPTVTGSTGTSVDLTALVGTPPLSADQLVDQINTLLMHGSLSSQAHDVIVTAVIAAPASDPLGQVKAATYLIASSSQFQVEH